jgi:hypothetical protein
MAVLGPAASVVLRRALQKLMHRAVSSKAPCALSAIEVSLSDAEQGVRVSLAPLSVKTASYVCSFAFVWLSTQQLAHPPPQGFHQDGLERLQPGCQWSVFVSQRARFPSRTLSPLCRGATWSR